MLIAAVQGGLKPVALRLIADCGERFYNGMAESGCQIEIAGPDANPLPLCFSRSNDPMEHIIQLHIERLPEGVYLATSDDVQGLVAQGRTIQETIEIARDVAKKLMETHDHASSMHLAPVREMFDYPLIVAS